MTKSGVKSKDILKSGYFEAARKIKKSPSEPDKKVLPGGLKRAAGMLDLPAAILSLFIYLEIEKSPG